MKDFILMASCFLIGLGAFAAAISLWRRGLPILGVLVGAAGALLFGVTLYSVS